MAFGSKEDHHGGMELRRQASSKRHTSTSPSDLQSLRKELQKERAARIGAEARVQMLEWKLEAMEVELQAFRKARNASEEFLQKQIRKLEKDVADRDELLEKVNAQIVWFRENYFAGNRSERDGVEGKPAEELRLQEDQESTELVEAASNATEGAAEESTSDANQKRKRGQQRGAKGPTRSDRSQLHTETEYLEKQDCACATCGKGYRRLEVTKSSPLVQLYTEIVRIMHKRYTYVPDCACSGGKPITADPPPKLYDRTDIGNTVWVHLVVQKFLTGVPTNRTLKGLSLQHLPLSQGTVTGGFKVISDKLEFLYQALIDHCRGADLWNGDETWWSIYGKRWWLWLVASDDAVVYLLDPSRSKKVPKDFFAGSKGVFMTDRLASYKGLSDFIRKAWCWVHQRRDFLNVFKGIPKLKKWAEKWLKRIAALYVLAHKRFKAWESNEAFGTDFEAVQANLTQYLDELKECFESELKQSGLHKKQKTILESLKRHWDGLTLFLEDPRIPLDNNRAERLLRNAVILRKNCYGSGAPWAGELAAKAFSIIQTWLINGLDPEALLLDYFNECSKPGRPPPDTTLFLPWTMSAERKKQFALPKGYKRPG